MSRINDPASMEIQRQLGLFAITFSAIDGYLLRVLLGLSKRDPVELKAEFVKAKMAGSRRALVHKEATRTLEGDWLARWCELCGRHEEIAGQRNRLLHDTWDQEEGGSYSLVRDVPAFGEFDPAAAIAKINAITLQALTLNSTLLAGELMIFAEELKRGHLLLDQTTKKPLGESRTPND